MKYRKATILLIEDDIVYANLIKESFGTSLNFKIYSAGSLAEGLNFLSQDIGFDAILSDLTLPDSQGIQTFDAIHSLVPHLPIIILSGVDDDVVVQYTLQNGAQDYLLKGNVNNLLLKRTINHAIERKQIEQRLKDALDLNQKIFCAAAMGVLTYKASGKCIFANEAASVIINSSVDKLLEQDFHSIDSWKTSNLYNAACEVLKTGIQKHEEFNFVTTFGKEVWIDCYLAKFCNMGEDHLLLILNDKTRKKQVEKSLEWKNYLMDMVLQNIPDLIYFKDLKGRITDVSKAMATKLGFADVKELIGKTDFDLYSYQHANQAYKDEQEIIRTRLAKTNYEEKETYENRPDVWVMTSKMPLLGPKGELIGTFGISRDITNRKLAEEALIKSKSQLAEAMDVAQLYQWEYDIESDNFIFDEKVWGFFGKENMQPGIYQMPLNEFLEDFIYAEDRKLFENEVYKAFENTKPEYFSQFEHRIIRLDKQIRHIMVRIRISMNNSTKPFRFYSIFQDITDKKIALQKSYEELNQMDSVKTEFLYLISQEIRTPLNGIVGALNLIKNQENSSAVRDLVETLDKSVSNLESFTENAIFYTGLSNNYQLTISEFNIKDLIQFAIWENINALNEKNIRVIIEPEINITIKADKDLFYKLLINILQIFVNNAKKKSSIQVEIAEESEKVSFAFSDNENFFSKDLLNEYSTIVGKYQNQQMGLSMNIIKLITDKHKGELSIFNKENAGATAKFHFPK